MFKIDLHIHTILGGDSYIQPHDLVMRAQQVGLDAVCVTEHHSYTLSEPLEKISRSTGFPIFRGLEYSAAEGHILVYGVKAEKGDLPPGMRMQDAIDAVHTRGGVAVPAHPYQMDLLGGSLGDRVLELRDLIALEAINGSASLEENKRAMGAATRLDIQGIGGSDAHGIPTLGRAYTIFPEPINTEKELVSALKEGIYTPCWDEDYR